MTLGYDARAVVQALSMHAVLSTLVAILVATTWHRVTSGGAPASVMARRLFLLRLAPSFTGVAAALIVLVGYVRWESHHHEEAVGPVAIVGAVLGGGLILAALIRGASALWQTRRIALALSRSREARLPELPMPAFVVASRFPIVALVGLTMVRLFVSRRVIDACTEDEFRAVVAHEHAHARAHDNLRRLAMAAAPDLLALLPAGARLQDAWSSAAELAADEWSARETASGVPLASALVKVARLATMPAPPLTASTLFDGEPIVTRVRRLLDPPPLPPPPRHTRWARGAVIATALAAAFLSLRLLHATAEALLRLGL